MTTALKLRRGTTAQHASFTGADGEVTVDTTKKTVVVHDGSTAGGTPLLKEANPSYTGTLTGGTGVVNIGSGQIYKDASGNVGLGTSIPLFKLAVVDSSGATRAHIVNGANAAGGAGIFLEVYNGGTQQSGVTIRADNADNLAFFNKGGERMRIDSAGNVGIGTSSPDSRLTVFGTNQRVRIGDGTNILDIGQWDGATNRVESSGRSLQFIQYGASNNITFATNATERMRIAANGDVYINGTSMPTGMGGSFLINGGRPLSYSTGEGAMFMKADAGGWQLGTYIVGSSGTRLGGFGFAGAGNSLGYLWAGQTGSGVGVQLPNGNNAWSALSDIREKVVHGLVENALDKVASIRPIYYNYNVDTNKNARRVGFIAQEVQAVLPEAVTEIQMNNENPTEETKRLSLAYTDTIPLLLAAIQELKSELDSVKSELEILKGN